MKDGTHRATGPSRVRASEDAHGTYPFTSGGFHESRTTFKRAKYSLIGALMLISTGLIAAQAHDDQMAADSHQHKSSAQDNELVRIVRESTERFKDVAVAEGEGYHLAFGCVSGGDSGRWGCTTSKPNICDGDAQTPARPRSSFTSRRRRPAEMTGADYLVQRSWDAKHPKGSAGAQGSALAPVQSPNRFGLDGVLHAARLGLEGQPERHVHELEPRGVV